MIWRKSLCEQFVKITNVFEVLTNLAFTPGPMSEVLFKNLNKIYGFGIALLKHLKQRATKIHPGFYADRFYFGY